MTKEKLEKGRELYEKMSKIEHALSMINVTMDEGDRVVIGIEDDYGEVDVIVDDPNLVKSIVQDVLSKKLQELHNEFENL